MLNNNVRKPLDSVSDSALYSLSGSHSAGHTDHRTGSGSLATQSNTHNNTKPPRRRRSALELHRSFHCQQHACNKRYEAWRSLQHHYHAKHGLRARKHDARWYLPNPSADYTTDPGSPEPYHHHPSYISASAYTPNMSATPLVFPRNVTAQIQPHPSKSMHGMSLSSDAFEGLPLAPGHDLITPHHQSWESFDASMTKTGSFSMLERECLLDPFVNVTPRGHLKSHVGCLATDGIDTDLIASALSMFDSNPMTEPCMSESDMLQLTRLLGQLNAVL